MNQMKCSELYVDWSEPPDDAEDERDYESGWRVCYEVDGDSYSYCVNFEKSFASRRDAEAVLRAFSENGVTAETIHSIPDGLDPDHPDWQRIDRIAAEALAW